MAVIIFIRFFLIFKLYKIYKSERLHSLSFVSSHSQVVNIVVKIQIFYIDGFFKFLNFIKSIKVKDCTVFSVIPLTDG